MGKSGSFDTGAGAVAPRTDEFLAGVLALSRISRVTVALESGHGAGPALLAAARLSAHAETCVLFDRWHGEPLAALESALLGAHPELAPAAGASLAQRLRALQAQQRHSFLIIFDRFDEYLAEGQDQPQVAAFDRVFVELANDSELDLHLLLVQDEASESLLERYAPHIPGIGDGCLRMPPAGYGDEPGPEPASGPESGRASRRDRSFGMLLERLTAIAPADEAAASAPVHASPAPDMARADPGRPAGDERQFPEQPFVFDATSVNDAMPAAEAPPAARAEPVFDAATALPEAAPAAPPPAADDVPAMPASPPRKSRAPAILAAVILAAGAGFYAYLQQAPATAPEPSEAVAQAPATPAVTAATEAPAAPMAAPTPAPAEAAPPPAAAPTAPTAPAAAVDMANTAAASRAGPTPARAAPTVYVHVRNQRERDRLQALTRTLAGQGIRVIDVKVMSKGPSVPDVRYFHDADRDTALTVQKALVSAGVPVPRLSRMNGYEGSTRPGHFEAWLGSAPAPEPVRRR